MKMYRTFLRRPAAFAAALALLAASFTPLLTNSSAIAATQVNTRSIQISNSTVSATGVSYKVTFTPQTSTGLSLVIDFCQESPIIGGTCTTTRGVTFTSPAITGSNLPSGWAYDTSSGSMIKLKGTSTTLTASTAYTFTVTGVNNPTGTVATAGATGTFYARIYTFTNNTYGTYTNAGSPGNYSDYGGFALSTANNVTITATVMETLTFCVSKLSPGPGCGASGQAVTTPTLTIGHGSPLALDTSAVDTDTAYTQLSTNANGGAIVNLKVTSSTTCAGLSRDGGTTCGIPAVGGFSAITAGTAAFGLNVADGTGGTGSVLHNANYGTTAGSYGMATATYGTYGDTIQTSNNAACANVNSLLTYGATASATTPAGVYTATHALIATGTF